MMNRPAGPVATLHGAADACRWEKAPTPATLDVAQIFSALLLVQDGGTLHAATRDEQWRIYAHTFFPALYTAQNLKSKRDACGLCCSRPANATVAHAGACGAQCRACLHCLALWLFQMRRAHNDTHCPFCRARVTERDIYYAE